MNDPEDVPFPYAKCAYEMGMAVLGDASRYVTYCVNCAMYDADSTEGREFDYQQWNSFYTNYIALSWREVRHHLRLFHQSYNEICQFYIENTEREAAQTFQKAQFRNYDHVSKLFMERNDAGAVDAGSDVPGADCIAAIVTYFDNLYKDDDVLFNMTDFFSDAVLGMILKIIQDATNDCLRLNCDTTDFAKKFSRFSLNNDYSFQDSIEITQFMDKHNIKIDARTYHFLIIAGACDHEGVSLYHNCNIAMNQGLTTKTQLRDRALMWARFGERPFSTYKDHMERNGLKGYTISPSIAEYLVDQGRFKYPYNPSTLNKLATAMFTAAPKRPIKKPKWKRSNTSPVLPGEAETPTSMTAFLVCAAAIAGIFMYVRK